MAVKMTITRIHAREILDSRGNPTIETEVTVETETTGKKASQLWTIRIRMESSNWR